MSRTPAKPVQMAVLTIGYQQLAMPSKQAMAMAEALQHAVPVQLDFDGRNEIFKVKEDPLRVEFALVRSSQIRMPHGEPASTSPTNPRLLK